jgi:hypothetical protein
VMRAIPRGSGGNITMLGLGQTAESRAHMMMIAIDIMVMVRLGGLGWQALATHASPWPMSDAHIRVQRKGTRPPMIPGVITTRNVLRRGSRGGPTVGSAAPTGFSAVQAQASQAVPALKPSPGAACGTFSREPGLADGNARAPMASGGASATSCAPLFRSARGCDTPNAGRQVINLLRGTPFFDHMGRRWRRTCAVLRALLLEATVAVPRIGGPPITRGRCHRARIASGANRRSGMNIATWSRRAGCNSIGNFLINIMIETLIVMPIQLLGRPRLGEDMTFLRGALRNSTTSILNHIHRADGQAIRPRGLCQIGCGGRRESRQEPAQDVALRLRSRSTGARLDKLPRPSRSERSTGSAPDHAL